MTPLTLSSTCAALSSIEGIITPKKAIDVATPAKMKAACVAVTATTFDSGWCGQPVLVRVFGCAASAARRLTSLTLAVS
jgi:hypothetical protein